MEIIFLVFIVVGMVVFSPTAFTHIQGETGWTAVWKYYYGGEPHNTYTLSVILLIGLLCLLVFSFGEEKEIIRNLFRRIKK